MLNRLKAPKGANRNRKRVGRGRSSGHGKTAGRGGKGQIGRSGGKTFPGFEGGQMPMNRRMPKVGFRAIAPKEFALVNIGDIAARFPAGAVVDVEKLQGARLVRRLLDGVKVLGDGEVPHALTVRAHRFSKGARAKIEAAGGKAEVV
jgi:large subunit ribosomal protein L15